MLRGAQIFVSRPCPKCGVVFRVCGEVGGFVLHEPLARSGLGMIFRAVDSKGRSLAVKILQPPLAAAAEEAAIFVSRIRTLAEMNDPNCPRIHGAGLAHGIPWMAMEWLPNGSLAARIHARGRLPEAEVMAIGLQAAGILQTVDEAGLRHRDLEPNNLVFDANDSVKVTDFAQAALYQSAADELSSVWGRTCYVSPERLRNEPEEAPSDIYSLGAVLFHALTGAPLFDGEPHGQMALEEMRRGEIQVELRLPSVHEATARVLNRMLASKSARRFRSWDEVIPLLREAEARVAERDFPGSARTVAANQRGRSAGWFWFWVSVVLALLIGLATLIAWQQRLGS